MFPKESSKESPKGFGLPKKLRIKMGMMCWIYHAIFIPKKMKRGTSFTLNTPLDSAVPLSSSSERKNPRRRKRSRTEVRIGKKMMMVFPMSIPH